MECDEVGGLMSSKNVVCGCGRDEGELIFKRMNASNSSFYAVRRSVPVAETRVN